MASGINFLSNLNKRAEIHAYLRTTNCTQKQIINFIQINWIKNQAMCFSLMTFQKWLHLVVKIKIKQISVLDTLQNKDKNIISITLNNTIADLNLKTLVLNLWRVYNALENYVHLIYV